MRHLSSAGSVLRSVLGSHIVIGSDFGSEIASDIGCDFVSDLWSNFCSLHGGNDREEKERLRDLYNNVSRAA